MGIFFNDNIFHELQVNGQELGDSTDNDVATDYTASDNDDQGTNQAGDNPADAPDDYTVPDQGEDQTPEEGDQNPPDQGTEADPNADNPDVGRDQPPAEAGDETIDYTDDGGGDAGGDRSGDDQEDSNYTDQGIPNDDQIKQLEDELFSKFSDTQIAIMTSTLKKNFLKMYDMLDTVIERINDTPKETAYISIIEFVTNKLSDIRDMLDDYLTDSFNTKSYIENEINYKRFCITLKQINAIIAEIYPEKK